LALRRWYLPTKRSSQPPHLGFAAFGHLFAPNQMAQANHSSAGGNNKQFPSVSLKNTDSNRYGGGISHSFGQMTCGSPARAGDLGRRAGRATCAVGGKEILYLISKIKSSIFTI